MAKVILVQKPDATQHVVPVANKAALLAHNKNLPLTQKWTIKEVEMTEDEQAKLPFINKDYVVPSPAKVEALQDENASLKERLAEMEAKLAAGANKAETVPVVVEKINKAETVEEIDVIVGSDDRKGVLTAADARKATLATI